VPKFSRMSKKSHIFFKEILFALFLKALFQVVRSQKKLDLSLCVLLFNPILETILNSQCVVFDVHKSFFGSRKIYIGLDRKVHSKLPKSTYYISKSSVLQICPHSLTFEGLSFKESFKVLIMVNGFFIMV
jgi:hypothetical protein